MGKTSHSMIYGKLYFLLFHDMKNVNFLLKINRFNVKEFRNMKFDLKIYICIFDTNMQREFYLAMGIFQKGIEN